MRWPGSHAVTLKSSVYPAMVERTLPPSPGWTSVDPMNHPSRPGPVAIACHTCSGVASTSASVTVSQSGISELLYRCDGCLGCAVKAWMDCNDDAVIAATFGGLVVIFGDQCSDCLGQLFGERGAIGGRSEAHLAV